MSCAQKEMPNPNSLPASRYAKGGPGCQACKLGTRDRANMTSAGLRIMRSIPELLLLVLEPRREQRDTLDICAIAQLEYSYLYMCTRPNILHNYRVLTPGSVKKVH